jgi:hypothetical protein
VPEHRTHHKPLARERDGEEHHAEGKLLREAQPACSHQHQTDHEVERHAEERRDRGALPLAELVAPQLHNERPIGADSRLEHTETANQQPEVGRDHLFGLPRSERQRRTTARAHKRTPQSSAGH